MENKHVLGKLDWLKQLRDSGQEVKILDRMPELQESNLWIWRAFNELSGMRTGDESGPHPIQMSALNNYVEFHRISSDMLRQELYHVVLILDADFVSQTKREISKARGRAERASKNKRR